MIQMGGDGQEPEVTCEEQKYHLVLRVLLAFESILLAGLSIEMLLISPIMFVFMGDTMMKASVLPSFCYQAMAFTWPLLQDLDFMRGFL